MQQTIQTWPNLSTDKPYLLVVEDEATQRQILTEYLSRQGLRAPDGTRQAFTAIEFDLLDLFCKHPKRPLTRQWLLETTSQRDYNGSHRGFDPRITRLRRKIEINPENPRSPRTVRGAGYMLSRE